MKRILLAFAVWLLASGMVLAQEPKQERASYQASGERLLFPKDFVRGYADFSVAPRHNEPDMGRCAGPFGPLGGSHAPCTAFARYIWSGYVELQPIGRGPLRHVFMFLEPKFFFGRNVPQFRYSASSAPIAFERAVGVGIELPKNFELRFVQHQVHWLGRFGKHLGSGDLRTDGPYGLYATVGVRWYFGGWGRADSSLAGASARRRI